MNAVTDIRPSIIGALAKALASVEGAQRNAENPHFKKAYADLGSVIYAIRPVAEHGIWYRQVPKRDADGALIETFYIHESGEELSAGEMFVPTNKRDPQGFGSAVTYCRRYALQTAFGIATEDDDAEAAMRGAERREGGNSRQGGSQQPRERQGGNSQQSRRQNAADDGMPAAAWSKLIGLIEATNADTQKMLNHFGVPDLKKLSPKQYDEAVAKLENDLAAMAKEDANRRGGTAHTDNSDIDY